MDSEQYQRPGLTAAPKYSPAAPLWRLAPTRAEDGRCVADFMMLIPGLGRRPRIYRERVAVLVRDVCESYGRQVVFADINYAINVLWVSVAAEPGLAGQVARAIRQRVPEALLVGGQLGAVAGMPACRTGFAAWRRRIGRLRAVAVRLLAAPRG
jgi:hypothetical protein